MDDCCNLLVAEGGILPVARAVRPVEVALDICEHGLPLSCMQG